MKKRTTITADDLLLERLRRIARREGVSLAEVMRQGLELRAAQPPKTLHFIATGRSRPDDGPTARESSEMTPEPPPWR